MLPTIGVLIGCYIAVRMLQLLLPPGQAAEHIVVKITAGFTLLVTVVGIVSLLQAGSAPPLR
jgi:hypothetical protein